MSIKFSIRNSAEKAKKEGDLFVRFSGTGEVFNRQCERSSRTTKTDPKGDPIEWTFVTGLDEKQVEFYKWLSDDEKTVVKDTIKELKPLIERYYGGEEVIKPENSSFWKRRKDINIVRVTNETVGVVFDTESPEHALLYVSILGGAFSDIVAPNKEWADRFQISHYLSLEIENSDFSEEEDITRSEAHGELAVVRKEFGKDALYILAWCIQYETLAYGAYSYATSEKDLLNYHIKYIDGKLPMKNGRKKNYPKIFTEYVEKWRNPQTRQLLYIEAFVKAGDYYNFISQREKKYVTSGGTILGNTIAEAVTNLMKPKFKVDLETLKESVEAKWKE